MTFTRLLELDVELTSRLRIKEPQSKLRPFGIFFAHSGDSWFILLALFIIWLTTKGLWHQLTALMAAGSVGLAVIVLMIKFSIKRRRPEGKWGAIYRNTDPHSFPSGHAARTAMLAVIAIAAGPLWFGILLVIWAPLVSLARVWMGVHYLSDVIVGIALGIVAGLAVLELSPWLVSTFPFIF
ncbi:MAG: phosphatase PAP2 family protein [Anaerolineaceae bacterium]|jgi:undecaprenyl-diphosphatase|nr:phosphatase PAP2 family protein [Anaerolineaceae bacterium]